MSRSLADLLIDCADDGHAGGGSLVKINDATEPFAAIVGLGRSRLDLTSSYKF